jgi:NADH-quinone oxidoreductase subunit C
MTSKKKTNAEPSETVEEKSHPVTEESKPEVAKKEESTLVPEPTFEKSIASRIVSKFGAKTVIGFIKPNRIRINTKNEDILDVASYMRDELNFDHAESVSGVDYPESKEIEVVYHLGSYSDPQLAKQILTLATRLPREDVPNPGKDSTRMPSLRDIFYSVEFHERECFEMLGVYFDGHPDNRRLLLPEDWADIPPLRKDFRVKGR